MVDILSRYDILGAFWMTVQLALWSALGSLILGTILAIMRVSPVTILQRLGAFYVNVARNTPLTLILVFCSLGALFILEIYLAPRDAPDSLAANAYRWAIVGLSAYHASFVCEALRSGVNTVPVGQAEAARAIGLPEAVIERRILLPVGLVSALPALVNFSIILTKETVILSIITVPELMYQPQRMSTETFRYLEAYLALALFFWGLVEIISRLGRRLESRITRHLIERT